MTSTLNIVVPLFLIMGLGYLVERVNFLGEGSVIILNKFVYYFALPTLLFGTMADSVFAKIMNFPFINAFLGGMFLTFVIYLILFKVFKPSHLALTGMRGFGASFPNASYMGLPLLITLFGQQGALLATLATVLSCILMAVLILLLETRLGSKASVLLTLKKISLGLLKNPLIVAPFLGIAYSFIGLKLPETVENFYHTLGAAATPIALFAIGQVLAKQKLTKIKELSVIAFGKLIIHPLITFTLLKLFQVNQELLIAGTLIAALPTGTLQYLIAQQYDIYEKESSALILLSTLLSIPTLACILTYFHL